MDGSDNVRAVSPEELRHHSRESIGQSNDLEAAPSETPEQMLPNLKRQRRHQIERINKCQQLSNVETWISLNFGQRKWEATKGSLEPTAARHVGQTNSGIV